MSTQPHRRRRAAVEAWVLVQTEPGLTGSAVSAGIRALSGVVSAEDLSGPYDVLSRVEGASLAEVARLVVGRIQLLDGVTRTLICPIVRIS